MIYRINNTIWRVVFVPANSRHLYRRDGSLTIGMTDGRTNTVYLSNRLSGNMLERVLAHELVHCFMFSYNIFIDLDEEEFIAEWIATYGRDLIYLLDDLLYRIKSA